MYSPSKALMMLIISRSILRTAPMRNPHMKSMASERSLPAFWNRSFAIIWVFFLSKPTDSELLMRSKVSESIKSMYSPLRVPSSCLPDGSFSSSSMSNLCDLATASLREGTVPLGYLTME